MNNCEFSILSFLSDSAEKELSKEEMAAKLYKPVEDIDRAWDKLTHDGYVKNGTITKKGKTFLGEHAIDNALILAAGMSTRFAPLSYEYPKGLLAVNGEVLIERQIRQLNEVGIEDIAIVVGHMADSFEYLIDKYGVKLIVVDDYAERNNHSSVLAAKDHIGNTIVTSSDLYFEENIFQKYAFDSYYCSVFKDGKTAERAIVTDGDDKIIETFYGDKACDTWVTLGYAFFSNDFSRKMIGYIEEEFDLPETKNKFWADIQDDHLDELYMYAKRVDEKIIQEFDSLEELRCFDSTYLDSSGSKIMEALCHLLAVKERNIVGIKSLYDIKPSLFYFRCKGDSFICDTEPSDEEKLVYQGRVYYQCRDFVNSPIKLYKLDRTLGVGERSVINVEDELDKLFSYSKEFKEYHDRALPLCAAENAISPFANLPLGYGFQERYIMNNTYSFNMDDNFIGCEKLFPYYQELSDVCERLFGAKYTDSRPFSGMHCIDMIVKCVCSPGDKMMILSKQHGGHASVQPVVERLGVEVYTAPYNLDEFDLDYERLNSMVAEEGIGYVLIASSDLIKPLDIERVDTSNCVLLYDCSQVMGLIAAGLCPNPLKSMQNVIMFGGTHKTFPGPTSGLVLTNDKYLHDKMETSINPKYLRNPQIHQKISLLFALIEFEQFGVDYMTHMVHCANYLGDKLRDAGYDVADIHGQTSYTHQVHFRCSKEEMDRIYDNASKCEVTLNKKHKDLFYGYGIRLGTQEIARYDWNDAALDTIVEIIKQLSDEDIDIEKVKREIAS